MKQLLILLGFMIFIPVNAQQKGNFDDNVRYKKIIKIGDKFVIKTLKYYHNKRRDISTFYEYSDSLLHEFKIDDNSEIINIAENADEYYCLLRRTSSLELVKTSKGKFNWVSVYKITDNSEDYDLIVSNNKIPKPISATRNGVGLKNLEKRYALMTNNAVEVKDMADSFTVIIKLLKL